MSSLYVFTGENSFLLRAERRRWEEEFSKKHGPENLLRVDGPKTAVKPLLDEVGSAPFGADKRLVIIDGTPKFSKEEVALLVQTQHPDCLVIVVDPSPDKRTSGVKAFLAAATVKEFAPLTGKALTLWMQAYAKECGVTLKPDAMEALMDIVGEEQDMLAREIEKLALMGKTDVGAAEVRLLAVPAGEREVWAMTGLITSGNAREAIAYLRASSSRGGDPFSLWNMLLWLLRSIVSVSATVASGERSPAKIAQLSGVPFPTARSLTDPIARIRQEDLRVLVSWAADADIALKSGGYRASADSLEELQALLETLVMKMAGVFTRS